MSTAIGQPVSGGTAHSILFVGPGTVLAQDNTNFKWNTTDKTLLVNGAGAKFGSFTAMNTGSTATSSTNNAIKTALSVTSIGSWSGTNAENRALYARASGGPAGANYAGFFDEGDVVLKQGRLGAQELKPTAKLHLGAGSTSPGTAAFKLNAGAKLSVAEIGAIEFDGTYAFITRSDGTRRLLTNNVMNVLEFGAVGDGNADDAQAFRDAVAELIATGGVIWVPPGLIYRINSSIDIRSDYPIFIISKMYLPRGIAYEQAPSAWGYIRPGHNITDGMFRWRAVDSAPDPFRAGGGGLLNVCIADQDPTTLDKRNYLVDAAVYVEGASYFVIRDCIIQSIKGTALHLGTVTVCNVDNSAIRYCGFLDEIPDPPTPYPAIHIGTVNFAALWLRNSVVEGNQDAASIHVVGTYNSGLRAQNCHFESGNGQLFIDGDGGVQVDFCHFGSNTGTSTHLKKARSTLSNCTFDSTPENETIIVDAQSCRLSKLFVISGQSGPSIRFTANANYSQASGLHFNGSGGIDATAATRVQLSNIVCVEPTAEVDSYVIDLGDNQLSNVIIDGENTSTCHGIRTAAGSVANCEVQRLVNANGITATGAATLVGNRAYVLGTGTAFTYAAGTIASGNYGYVAAATDGDSNDVITLNAETGVLTTKSLTTAPGAEYTLTFYNALINANSRLLLSLKKEGTGSPVVVNSYVTNAGFAWITIRNVDTSDALNNPLQIQFSVHN